MTPTPFPELDALLERERVVEKGDTTDQPIFEQVWKKTYEPAPARKRARPPMPKAKPTTLDVEDELA